MIGLSTAIIHDKRILRKDGSYAVKLRITYYRVQKYYPVNISLTIDDWEKVYSEKPKKEYKENKAYFTELFEVGELMNVQVRTLSLGERMKMELMVALLHNPKILFLDEPTIGLDAIASKQIRRFLKAVNKEKKTTIILTSHYMEDIKALCERSIVINHGVKIYDGKTKELFEKYQVSKKITVTFEKPVKEMKMDTLNVSYLEDHAFQKILYVPKEGINELLAHIMAYEPNDISIEEEEVGVVVERIYKEGSDSIV